jgi:glycosyltransferase involved in cell wall biosynthesis
MTNEISSGRVSPCVSVITPAYNAAKFLPETIESILNQTFRNFEYIIVDDASTDETWEVITRYAAQDSRIVPLQNKKNLSAPGSRNYAMTVAKGNYIAVQDADDISMPQRLEHQTDYLDNHPELGAVGALVYFVDSNRKFNSEQRPVGDPDTIRAAILFATPLLHTTLMYRRTVLEQIGGYSTEFSRVEDPEMLWRLSRVCEIGVIQEPLCEYRVHNSSDRLSNNIAQHEQYAEVMTRAMAQWLNSPTFPREVYKRFWKLTHHNYVGDLQRGDIRKLNDVWYALAADKRYKAYYRTHLLRCHRRILRRYPGEALQFAKILRTHFNISTRTLLRHYYERFTSEKFRKMIRKSSAFR